jgi:hypothetical protein
MQDDDQTQIGQRFSVLDIARFLTAGIRYLNNNHPCATKFQYLTLQPRVDSYALPSDLMHSKYAIEVRAQEQLKRTNEADVIRKTLGKVYGYSVFDQNNRRRLLFKQVPDVWYGADYLVDSYVSASAKLTYYGLGIYADQCYFTPTIIELTSGTTVEYLRASVSDESTTGYRDTALDVDGVTVSGDTTLTASATVESYIKAGDVIRLGLTDSYTVSAVDDDEITLTTALTADYNGKDIYKQVNLYSCYISERNITGELTTPITIAAGQTVNLVDVAHNYICQTPDYFSMGVGTVTTVGTAVTGVSTTFTDDFAVGDYIQVGLKQFAKVAVVTDDTHLTLDKAFYRDIATASNYYIINASVTPIIPIDYHNYLVDFAKWYAFQAESRTDLVTTQYLVCEEILKKIESEQAWEAAIRYNQNLPATVFTLDPDWVNTNNGTGINSEVTNG